MEHIKIITGDQNTKAHEVDMLTSGLRETNPEELMEIARQASERYDEFVAIIKPLMTRQRAKRIKELRREAKLSWRELAFKTYREWGCVKYWHPLSNQIAGIALCHVAASVLNEEVWDKPMTEAEFMRQLNQTDTNQRLD